VTWSDRLLQCSQCGESFVFSAGEQELLAVRGAQGAPNRCPRCRRAHGQGLFQQERAAT